MSEESKKLVDYSELLEAFMSTVEVKSKMRVKSEAEGIAPPSIKLHVPAHAVGSGSSGGIFTSISSDPTVFGSSSSSSYADPRTPGFTEKDLEKLKEAILKVKWPGTSVSGVILSDGDLFDLPEKPKKRTRKAKAVKPTEPLREDPTGIRGSW